MDTVIFTDAEIDTTMKLTPTLFLILVQIYILMIILKQTLT